MTVLDDKLVPKAKELLDKFGKSATFSVSGFSQYDPNTGEVTVGTPTTYTVKVTPPSPFDKNYQPGGTTEASDLRVYLAASGLSFTPSNGQKVVFDSESYNVIAVETIFSGDSVALYGVRIRR